MDKVYDILVIFRALNIVIWLVIICLILLLQNSTQRKKAKYFKLKMIVWKIFLPSVKQAVQEIETYLKNREIKIISFNE
jgi:hypothetical protein